MGEWQAKLSSAPTAAFLFGDFCNKIGTNATQGHVRFSAVVGRPKLRGAGNHSGKIDV
jgi:hypothetical protein